MSKIWGYILDAPGRPKAEDQRRALALLGADTGELGTVWRDKIKRGSTRPRHQLLEREALLAAMQPGDALAVAAPFCLGLSGKDAGWFLTALAEGGVSVIVSDGIERIEPGADTSDLVKRVASAQLEPSIVPAPVSVT